MTPVVADLARWSSRLMSMRPSSSTLRLWLPTYLAQIERERGMDVGYLPRPRAESYINALDDIEFPDNKLPAVVVTTSPMEAQPQKDGTGQYAGDFVVEINAVIRGPRPPRTRHLAAMWGGCVRRALMQQQDLDGFASEITLMGHEVRAIRDRTNAGRYLASGWNNFVVHANDVLNVFNGPSLTDDPYDPADPENNPDQPYDSLVQVTEVDVAVVGIPVDQTPGD